GEPESAADAGRRLESLPNLSAAELYHVIGARIGMNQLSGIVKLIRQAEKLADPNNGYPEIYIADELGGVAEYIEAVGEQPVNQVTAFGDATMKPAPVVNL